MLRRLIQWFKRLFRSLFGGQPTSSNIRDHVPDKPAPPLTNTDLEFLFNELLEGVHQARGKDWAQKWLDNIEHRVSTQRWVEWLRRFGERLLASPTPNNELAARFVQLGNLGLGQVGDVAYEIGMQVLTRNQGEPIWEYDGPDAVNTTLPSPDNDPVEEKVSQEENSPTEGATQTVTLDQLLIMLQQDQNLRQQIAQQLSIETDDPQLIVQELINQYNAPSQSNTDQT
ncbi:hypothetical protein PN465_16345 [Nodularia spumigena CS-584]|jgi:hypothetical protein|uniref:Uncharacterized protein n=1 Tax=Nodularia spumigena UHCC 0060 TaxID=3110300 RepID=A0ABU5US21_NODSP|nr:hypothetical protein [Nodularia spumigena]AHJ30631.1 TPR repeat protein [Nodularia spumigena CCY9414]EAW43083.1 hypothetical protein N9414_18423 [Nodularia spumigena CCY9414]MDB9383773.1 hypothetical protein [Nodularia spumigena CS-584]MEA5525424.1 hypothetical protein [Nodularia spumigena UHCC 0143]MEA5559077.1 hypothetical protein [Nodularia spumigena CH309]